MHKAAPIFKNWSILCTKRQYFYRKEFKVQSETISKVQRNSSILKKMLFIETSSCFLCLLQLKLSLIAQSNPECKFQFFKDTNGYQPKDLNPNIMQWVLKKKITYDVKLRWGFYDLPWNHEIRVKTSSLTEKQWGLTGLRKLFGIPVNHKFNKLAFPEHV